MHVFSETLGADLLLGLLLLSPPVRPEGA